MAVRAPGSTSHSEKAKGRLCFVFSVVYHFTERFKQKGNTSEITAVTKVSMKPRRRCYTANRHLRGSEERNGD